MAGAIPFGCGQCLPCRINKRRQWMWRQFFESLSHEQNCFVTLTYSDEHLPADLSLQPTHLSLWLKRLRKHIHPVRVRFFAVGEYGVGGVRGINPHYHVSLFGLSGHTDLKRDGSVRQHLGCSKIVWDTWGKGIATTYEFNEKTAQYVAGYTVKKLTSFDDPRLQGRHPEFMRSSRRPGLGVEAMKVVAEQLLATGNLADDVPRTLMLGKKQIPLGRFLLKKLRLAAGMTDAQIDLAKTQTSMERSLEMLALFKNIETAEEVPTFKKAHVAETYQRVLNAEARYKIWDEKKDKL